MEVRDPIVVYNKSKFTVEEYLAMEKESLEKHEFFRGDKSLTIAAVEVTLPLSEIYEGTKL